MVQNGLSRPTVYKTPIYRLRIHTNMRDSIDVKNDLQNAMNIIGVLIDHDGPLQREVLGQHLNTAWQLLNGVLGTVE